MYPSPNVPCARHDKYGVREYVNTALCEVKENAFTVKLPGWTDQIWNSTSIQLSWNSSNNPHLPQIEEAFKDTDTYVYTIGDSVRARRIMEGTMEYQCCAERTGISGLSAFRTA